MIDPSAVALVPPAPSETELRGLASDGRTALCREYLAQVRRHVAELHAAGRSGCDTARTWACAVDRIVALLLAVADDGSLPPLVLLAVGGYGRAELCPASDLDLWFITPEAADPRIARLAEAVLYPLWDLKLQVGHAVRSVNDTVALGREDLSAATALLDVRMLAGDGRLFEELCQAARRDIFGSSLVAFVRQLEAERNRRHARFGDTVYLLEPDIKNGHGAYRDLLVSLWAAKARFGVADFPELLALGQASLRQIKELVEAREFFLRVRTAAHLYARRRQDRLNFEVQEAIAPLLATTLGVPHAPAGPLSAAVHPSVAPAVEALMRAYYLHAKAVLREGQRLLERCVEETGKRPTIRRLDDSLVLWNGQLSTTGPEVLHERPAEMVRMFCVALEQQASIYGHTRDLIAELSARPDTAQALAADPDAARHFLALLIDSRDNGTPSLLEQMHDLGLVAALMPEFAPCTARVQHDIYHVFTVDQHSLYAVGRLKAIERGELQAELPLATQAAREVERKVALYLGTLLHDVGKPLGADHSRRGARLAVGIARRLGLSAEDTALVELLVAKHLVLAHVSQRRDLNDQAMLARLADELGDTETLRALYLLTLADMSMVAPGNLTTWKEELLRTLYQRTLAHLQRDAESELVDVTVSTVTRRKDRVAALLGETEGSLDEWMSGMPERYFTDTSARLIARHVQLSRARVAGGVALAATHYTVKGWSELSVLADDAPGLLARLAGVLLASRIDVMRASIACRRHSGGVEAIDDFMVRDRYGRALTDEIVAVVRGDLERVLGNQVPVETLLAERRPRSTLQEPVVPAVATEIKIDNRVSDDFTVVDVITQDRPGVLYTITHTLSELGLDIGLSKVATEANRVADVFYVRDGHGQKLQDTQAACVQRALIAAIARFTQLEQSLVASTE